MPGPVIVAGLALLAGLAVAAWLLPAPQVSDDAWTCARIGLVPVGLLWLVSLTFFSRPAAFAFAMTSGAGFWAVLWVLRSPPEALQRRRDGGEEPGGGGGGGPGDRRRPARPATRRRHGRLGLGRVRARRPTTHGGTRPTRRARAGCQTERGHGF